jgi:hypothetical protein
MLAFFGRIVKSPSFQNDIEQYIIAHNPKSAADVERLIKEYTYGNTRVWL